MKKFYYNKEDMLGDVRKEQKEALKDLKITTKLIKN